MCIMAEAGHQASDGRWAHGMTMTRTRIESLLKRLRRAVTCTRGDVLMEYVIVTVFIILPLVGAATASFNPAGRAFYVQGAIAGTDFGFFGNSFVQLYRMIMSGISLPLP